MMKKIIFGILAIAIISCNSSKSSAYSNPKPVDYALFSGTIKNSKSDTLTILNNSRKVVRKIKMSDTGVFADTIFKPNGYYIFIDGKEKSAIYLKNGYNIHLEMDTKAFDETIIYTGNGSDVNNYLARKVLIKEKKGTGTAPYLLDETAYLSAMDQEKETFEIALIGLDPEFVKQERSAIKYDYIADVQAYPYGHSRYTKNKDFKVSEAFPDVLKGLEYNNEEHFKSFPRYQNLVRNNFFKMASEKAKREKTSFTTAAINFIKASKSEIINNSLLAQISRSIGANNPELEELYNGIMELSTDEAFKKQLTKKFKSLKNLSKGSASPVFVNYENHAGGTTSLTDFRGKYVYVDVWATWCGPCKREIPFLKEVEKAYHDKNIEFVSVSLDTEKAYETWKNMVTEKELSGIQLFADNHFLSDFAQNYGIQSIPRFILIDPEGKIVDSEAPRPSEPKLIALFNTLKI